MKKAIFALVVLVSAISARAEEARQLRITAAGDATPVAQMEASAGETLLLKADVYATGPQCGALTGCGVGISPSEFLWVSDDRPDAVCGLSSSSHCVAETRFTPTPSGVSFRVPDSFDTPITIVVRERGASSMGTLVVVPRPAPVLAAEAPTPVYFTTPPPPPPVVIVRPYPNRWPEHWPHHWGHYWPHYYPRYYPQPSRGWGHGPSVHIDIGGRHHGGRR